MGANVTRIDPKTGKQRTYYKADDGKLYNDYNAAASGNMNPVARVQRWAGEKIDQVFGRPQAPNYRGIVGKSTDPVFDTNGNVTPAAKTLLQQSNTGASIVQRNDRNILAKVAEQVDPITYGNRAYANPYNNKTFVNNQNLGTLMHELGHLDKSQRQGGERFTQSVGVLGRALTEIGKIQGLNSGLIQPTNIAAGVARQFADAKEEDVAERYRVQYSPTVFSDHKNNASETVSSINTQGSRYGNKERQEGQYTMWDGLDPSGLFRSSAAAIHNSIGAFQQGQRDQRITELEGLHKQDQTRFQQLPEDFNKFTPDQKSFMQEATKRTEELNRLRNETFEYKNGRY